MLAFDLLYIKKSIFIVSNKYLLNRFILRTNYRYIVIFYRASTLVASLMVEPDRFPLPAGTRCFFDFYVVFTHSVNCDATDMTTCRVSSRVRY